MLRGVGVSLF
uniref:Uncharacterized protein n=1 Tax=Anguilla anguilla TaxID=7936 RepID=A0A0E9TH36_ANGAN